MLKILSSEQIRKADAATIENEPILSIDLMERAATVLFNSLINRYPSKNNGFYIFCGQGNNGGDGMVLARLLSDYGCDVQVYILKSKKVGSPDFEKNLERILSKKIPVLYLTEKKHHVKFNSSTIIIDAIFGSGLNKAISGYISKLIQQINESKCKIIAVDIPSGLFSEDNEDHKKRAIVKANFTYTFESPKLSFFFPENYSYVGKWEVLTIGLDKDFIDQLDVNNYFFQIKDAVALIKPRNFFDHKGTYGHSLIIAGSYGKIGAAVLCAKACLRTGTGLLSVHAPNCGYPILQTAVPEAMVIADENPRFVEMHLKESSFTSIGIGPGIGTTKETAKVLKLLIQNSTKNLVLDADALNILSENKTWLSFLPPNCILTPHPGEFKRLVGEWESDYERYELLKTFSIKYKVIVVLKGYFTTVATPSGRVYFNSTGNPGMATAGSGDVLTGMITSLLAQSYSPLEATLLAVYLHGLAGDIAAKQKGEHALIAGDIVDSISDAYLKLQREKS